MEPEELEGEARKTSGGMEFGWMKDKSRQGRSVLLRVPLRQVAPSQPPLYIVSSLVNYIKASPAAQWQRIHLPVQEMQARFLGREDLLEKEVAPHSSTPPGKSHGWRSLVDYSPWGLKELDMTEWLHFTSFNTLHVPLLWDLIPFMLYKCQLFIPLL